MSYGLPHCVLETLDTGRVRLASGEERVLDSNVNIHEASALYGATRDIAAKRTAEVGLAYGISAASIAKGLIDNGGGEHHVMDPFQQRYGDGGLQLLRAGGLDHVVRFHRRFAEEIFPSLPLLDLVFIDASHLFDLTVVEFVLADKRLRVGGLIALHDLWMQPVRKVFRFILANRAYEIERKWSDASQGGQVPTRMTPKQRVADLIARFAECVPQGRRLFNEELICPWFRFRLGNMVFLRKLADDDRDWQHFKPF